MGRTRKNEKKQLYIRSGPAAVVEQTLLEFLVTINYQGSTNTVAAVSAILKKVYENIEILEDGLLYTDLKEQFKRYVMEFNMNKITNSEGAATDEIITSEIDDETMIEDLNFKVNGNSCDSDNLKEDRDEQA